MAIGTNPWVVYAKLNRSWPKYVLLGQIRGSYERMLSIGEVPASEAGFQDAECINPSWRRHPGLLIRREIAHFDGVGLRVSETAPPDLKGKAWSADLDCLGSWRGCESGLDLHPAAARIYEDDKHAFTADWPEIVLSNPACKHFWHLYQDK
jgi:hypothetical protein